METVLSQGPAMVTKEPHKLSATQIAGMAVGSKTTIGTEMDLEKIAAGIKLVLEGIGENPDREGLLETPSRVARMYNELLYGINRDAAEEITCKFTEGDDELILVRDISFSSICEHHLVPFIGTCACRIYPRQWQNNRTVKNRSGRRTCLQTAAGARAHDF